MTSLPPPPSPSHLLRSHKAPLSAIAFSLDNERIYSGDVSGVVIVTSTRSFRAVALWMAHTDAILGVEEWERLIITHGRDNKLHVWIRIEEPTPIRVGGFAISSDLSPPPLCYSMDVNALNYCRFSLATPTAPSLGPSSAESLFSKTALVALPNLVESSLADIWTLPSCQRLHAAIGKAGNSADSSPTGIIMSLHLYGTSATDVSTSFSSGNEELRLLCAYENGGVKLWRYARANKSTSVEGIGWEALWQVRLHAETIMAMSVSSDNSTALTVSVEHLVVRYDLNATTAENVGTVHRTKHPGNASTDIRDDGRVCAIGGWDGKIRLYSTRSLKPLGTLSYHKNGCQVVAFAHSLRPEETSLSTLNLDQRDDEMSSADSETRSRWLVGGGKDGKVSIWALMNFERPRGGGGHGGSR